MAARLHPPLQAYSKGPNSPKFEPLPNQHEDFCPVALLGAIPTPQQGCSSRVLFLHPSMQPQRCPCPSFPSSPPKSVPRLLPAAGGHGPLDKA